ncbi:unnamed protein product, partial [Didymodactylos carnosus]
KITELAFEWKNSCVNVDDAEEEHEVEQVQLPQQEQESTVETSDQPIPTIILKSTSGDIIPSSTTFCLPIEEKGVKRLLNRVITQTQNRRLGALSRLLLLALKELKMKHELRITRSGIFVTKHELKTLNIDSYSIRKIYITPCNILYEGPFRDEDYRKLTNASDSMINLYEYIKSVLIRGIIICDRRYEFLAFSSSQLRDHSTWMFATNARSNRTNAFITATDIRRWMGNFSESRPVSKYAARLGQSFSTTVEGVEIEKGSFHRIEDEKSRNGDYFTDGIGISSLRLNKELAVQLKLDRVPSAFQIRFAGSKGMICLDVANKIPENSGIDLLIRPSMEKFSSLNQSIGIVRSSASPSPAFLNRQIILLLSSLGVSNHIFYEIQENMLKKISNITKNPSAAQELLREFIESGSNSGCHSFMIECFKRFGTKIDPFLKQMVICFQAFLLKELRTKARIFVKDGACLLGVIDETRTLNYGQIFIQIEAHKKSQSRIIQGQVIVTKNPCFHPGDIRLLTAVDVPALHQLKNVIVFPMKGYQPHTSEISGSDLDGDCYFVSWDKQLLFSSNERPLNYHDQGLEAQQQALLNPEVQITINDVCEFFGEYIAADNLGLIANSHLSFADQLPERARAEKCIQLAHMHSIAVDFAKNGIRAPRLTKELRPVTYPHYMEKNDKPQYISTTILGQLYDRVQDHQRDLNEENYEQYNNLINTFPYEKFHIDGKDDYLEDAYIIKQEYDRELRRIMRQYGIKRESELISGYILRLMNKKYNKESKMFELRQEISHAVRFVRDKYIKLFWNDFYNREQIEQEVCENKTENSQDLLKRITWKNQLDLAKINNIVSDNTKDEMDDEIYKKASAWFSATYDEQMNSRENRQKKKQKPEHFGNDKRRDLSTGLKLKTFRCDFSMTKLRYLGPEIAPAEVKSDPKTTSAVNNY